MIRFLPLVILLAGAASTLPVACAADMPQSACASNPDLTTQAEVDACRNKFRDASPGDVMRAVVVVAQPVAAPVVASKDGGAHG